MSEDLIDSNTLIHKTTNGGWIGFSFEIKNGESYALRRCLDCDQTFPQDDEGTRALREHEVAEHDKADIVPWSDLNGVTLTLAVVQPVHAEGWLGTRVSTDVYGRTESGDVYLLHHDFGSYHEGAERKVWKWRPSRESNLSRLTLPGPASPSNG